MKTDQFAGFYPNIKLQDAQAIKAFAEGFAPAASLKGEAAAQWNVAQKFRGVIEMHPIKDIPWDVAIDYGKIPAYEPVEFKPTKPLENKIVLSLAQLCGVADGTMFARMEWKDWGAMLGAQKIANQDDMATLIARARRDDQDLTVLELNSSQVEVDNAQGLRLLLKDTASNSLAFLSKENIGRLLFDREIFSNALRGARFVDSAGLYLATRADGANVFYFSFKGLDDEGNQIMRKGSNQRAQRDNWEVLVPVSEDGKKILEIQCFWDDRAESSTFKSIADFENSQFAEDNELHWRTLGTYLTFLCLNVGSTSPFYVGSMTASKNDLVKALNKHVKRNPRLGRGAKGSLLIDERVLDGENPEDVFPSFAMPFDEFEEKLEDWTWDPRQERFMERYFVAAGISENCPGYDVRAQKAFVMAVVSAAWYAAQNPFSRVDVPTSTAVFNRMFDVWVGKSEPGYKAADRDATIERLVGDVVYKAGGREVKVRDEVFVVESVTDTHFRVRAVEVAEQTSDAPDTYYSDVLVRNAVNVRKCCKDFIIRLLFQAIWVYAFAQAGLELVAWPAQGLAGLNAFIIGTIGTGAAATEVWIPTCIMHGLDAITPSHWYTAPSGATIDGLSSKITYSPEDKPNTFAAYFLASGCMRPGVLLGLRDAMMGLASFALPTATTPLAMLDGRRKADDGRIVRFCDKKTGAVSSATLVVDGAGTMNQGPLADSLMTATRRDHGSRAGPLPYALPGAADTTAVLRRSFEAVLLSLIVALLDAARPRVAPAPTPAPALSDEEDGPAARTRSAATPATTTSEPPAKRTKSGRTTSDYRRIGAGSVAAMAYTPMTPRGVEAFVARMVPMLAGGGAIIPTCASSLNISYRPLAVLGDKPKTTEDWIKAWTIAAQTGVARRNGTRPTFVLATSIQEGIVWRYKFEPSRNHFWLTNIRGTKLATSR